MLIALGLGAALAVYELSPGARASFEAYLRAIRAADAAHRTADVQLQTATATAAVQQAQGAQQAGPPQWLPVSEPTPLPAQAIEQAATTAAAAAAVDLAAAAIAANQEAAQRTMEAAESATTPPQRREVAQSATKVLEREQRIVAALASLGIGQCDVRAYARVTARVKDALLARLRSEGMTVTGNNPWNIDTQQYDVKLRAVWDPGSSVVKLIVTAGKGGYFGLVTCTEIWKKIDPIMKDVIGD